MYFIVEVTFFHGEKLQDSYCSAYINEDSEMLMLFKDISEPYTKTNKMIRYAIPLTDIQSVVFKPIYEDNRQKISRC